MPPLKKLSFTDNPVLFNEGPLPEPSTEGQDEQVPWKVLVVDDEESVHRVTSLVLRGQTYQGRPIHLFNAYSAEGAREVLQREPEIALILLDVVMETSEAGLELIRYVREELKDKLIRIVLRTGQPAQAPARKVILGYEIHDYKTKTELTEDKLYTTVITALRSFQALHELHLYRTQLEEKVEERMQQIQEKNLYLEELHREKDGILGMVIHDLRTPLGQIKGLVQLLEQQLPAESNEEVRFMLEKIDEASENGLMLIQDLMLVNRLSSERERSRQIEAIELATYLRELLPFYQRLAQKKSIQLHLAEELPSMRLQTDVPYLSRILDNLLSNAVKFTHPHKNIYLAASGNPTEGLTLRVRDEGQGIREEELPQLFKKFSRLSARPTGHEQSTGLGLSIVRELVHQLGGKIWVESQWGEGSTFFVWLPVRLAPEA